MGIVLLTAQLSAQTAFDNLYGNTDCYTEAFTLLPTATGYVASTAELCTGNTDWTGALTFFDMNGDSAGTAASPHANGFAMATTDGNLLLLGGTQAGLTYDTIQIAKLNPQGDTIWTSDLFFPQCRNQVYSGTNTLDGGYAVAGIYSVNTCSTTASFNSWVAKLDANGNLLWRKTFGGADDDELQVIRQRPDGGLTLFGWSKSYGAGDADLWLLQLTANGDSVQSTTWGEQGVDDFGYGMDISRSGNIVVVYYSDSTYAQLMDNQGVPKWRKALSVPSGGRYHSAQATQDERFVFLSCFDSPSGCESHLVKLDTTGALLWDKTWGGLMRTVVETEPGVFLLAGYKGDAFPAKPQAHVVRFDTTVLAVDTSTGLTGRLAEPLAATIYPNPATTQLTIQYEGHTIGFTCYNALGARVALPDMPIGLASKGILTLDISHWPKGLYLLSIELNGQAGGTHFTHKLIKD